MTIDCTHRGITVLNESDLTDLIDKFLAMREREERAVEILREEVESKYVIYSPNSAVVQALSTLTSQEGGKTEAEAFLNGSLLAMRNREEKVIELVENIDYDNFDLQREKLLSILTSQEGGRA